MIQPDDQLPRSPLTDWELQAVAVAIIRQYGDGAPLHIAKQIGACAVVDDAEGVATWKAVALRMDTIMNDGRNK